MKTFISLGVIVILCWVPQTVFWIIVNFDSYSYDFVTDQVTSFLWGITVVIHPIVYQFLNDDIRYAALAIFVPRKWQRRVATSHGTTSAPQY